MVGKSNENRTVNDDCGALFVQGFCGPYALRNFLIILHGRSARDNGTGTVA